MLSFFGSIVLAVVVLCLMGSAEQKFAGKDFVERVQEIDADFPFEFKVSNFVKSEWTRAFAFATTLGVVNFLTPKIPALGPVFLGVMICLFIYLMYRWYEEGKTFSGMLAFAGVALLAFFTALATAETTVAALSLAGGWKKLFFLIPPGLLMSTIGFFIFDMLDFKSSKLAAEAEKVKNPKKAEMLKRSKLARWVSRGVVAVLVLSLLVGGLDAVGFNLPSWLSSAKTAEATTVSAAPALASKEPFYGFRNTLLQDNGDDSDDYNFGPNPREAHPDWEKRDDAARLFDDDFRNRMTGDPDCKADVALAAAAMAWVDVHTGTRYLGTFYESCKEDWAETMNVSKEAFMMSEEQYRRRLVALFKFLDSAVSVDIREATDMDDQMYMNPHTVDGVPDIVVFKSNDHTGLFLVYTFEIKGEKVEVAFRIDCGYQPTNVEKVMKITPQPNPNPPPRREPPKEDPPPSDPPPNNPPPNNPPPNNPPPNNPTKDKTQGTQGDVVKPNDDPGPGPNTNNPSNPNQSTEDKGDDRSDDGDLGDYNKEIEKLEDANDGTQPGGGSNNPSTSSSEVNEQLGNPAGTPVNVDNPAGTGTSTSAPIDKPTEVQSGEVGSTSGQTWGGPPPEK